MWMSGPFEDQWTHVAEGHRNDLAPLRVLVELYQKVGRVEVRRTGHGTVQLEEVKEEALGRVEAALEVAKEVELDLLIFEIAPLIFEIALWIS
jgi:hypothetical protein